MSRLRGLRAWLHGETLCRFLCRACGKMITSHDADRACALALQHQERKHAGRATVEPFFPGDRA